MNIAMNNDLPNTYLFPDLCDICTEYISNSNCLFKIIRDEYKESTKYYLVVLEKTPNTKTNEDNKFQYCSYVDRNHASYRGNEFKVLLIINVYDLNDRPNDILHTWSGSITRYECASYATNYIVNQIVRPHQFDYDDNEDLYGHISGGGIYYYRTIETAYHNGIPIIGNYTGPKNKWEYNGKLKFKTEYVNGNIEKCTFFDR